MKKKYVVPSMMVVEVKSATMIAGSITGTNVGMGSGGDTDSNNITEGASRRRSIWDSVWNNESIWDSAWNNEK